MVEEMGKIVKPDGLMAAAGRGSIEAKFNISLLDENSPRNFPPPDFFYLISLGLFIRQAKNKPLPWREGIEGRGSFFNPLHDSRGEIGAGPECHCQIIDAAGLSP
jgi:hypothetical protein